MEINEEAAEKLYHSFKVGEEEVLDDGTVLTAVAFQPSTRVHRWADTAYLVYSDQDGKLWALPVDIPSTEMQEGQGYWCYSKCEFIPVKEETTIRYIDA